MNMHMYTTKRWYINRSSLTLCNQLQDNVAFRTTMHVTQQITSATIWARGGYLLSSREVSSVMGNRIAHWETMNSVLDVNNTLIQD